MKLFKTCLNLDLLSLSFVSLLWILFPLGTYLDFISFPFLWCLVVTISMLFVDLLLQILYPKQYKELFKRR